MQYLSRFARPQLYCTWLGSRSGEVQYELHSGNAGSTTVPGQMRRLRGRGVGNRTTWEEIRRKTQDPQYIFTKSGSGYVAECVVRAMDGCCPVSLALIGHIKQCHKRWVPIKVGHAITCPCALQRTRFGPGRNRGSGLGVEMDYRGFRHFSFAPIPYDQPVAPACNSPNPWSRRSLSRRAQASGCRDWNTGNRSRRRREYLQVPGVKIPPNTEWGVEDEQRPRGSAAGSGWLIWLALGGGYTVSSRQVRP